MNKIHDYKFTICTDKSIMFDNILMKVERHPYYFSIYINGIVTPKSINNKFLYVDLTERYTNHNIDRMTKLFLKEKYKSGIQRR